MHFGLTEEQDLLQEALRRFATQELPATRLRECFDEGSGEEPSLWSAAAEVGLQGLIVPERYGGSGLEFLDLALAFEVLGEAALPGPYLAQALTALALVRSDDEEARARWLPSLATGDLIAGCALAESTETWAADRWTLEAKSGRWSGQKRYAELAPTTDILLVGLAGGGLGLVEARDPGVSVAPLEGMDRSRPLAHVQLDGARVHPIDRDPSAGRAIVDAACILLAADAFGAAGTLIRATVEYTRTREQFGTPIAQFQAVKHQLASMLKEWEPMRGLIWSAAYSLDHRPDQLSREASTAKSHITDRAVQIGRDAVSLHGGLGFTWECDVHFFLKRAMHDRGWLGTPEAHRERLAHAAGW